MHSFNKLVSDFPRGPAKKNIDTINNKDYTVVFDDDHDFNFKVSHVYEYLSKIHGDKVKRMVLDNLHSGIADSNWDTLMKMYSWLVCIDYVDLYETRKLLVYSNGEGN